MSILRVVGLASIASLFLAVPALPQEKKIKRSELPVAVEKAVAVLSQGATVRGYSKEKEHGRTFYEAELVVNGHSKDVLMDAYGQIVEVEEQVEMRTLPTTVQAALKQRAGKANITKIESIAKRGAIVAYEVQVMTQGKHKEIQVGPDGQRLDHEE